MKTLSIAPGLVIMKPIVQYAFFMALLFTGCKLDREKSIDRARFSFKITADSYLFFKNVRQIYYDFNDLKEAGWHAYRLSNRYRGNDVPVLNPTLVVDWRKDEAYVLIETNAVLADLPALVIYEQSSSSGITYSYTLAERGKENMLEFATKIYEGIMAENEFTIDVNGVNIPIFQGEEARENFRVAMADYYRLTRIIR